VTLPEISDPAEWYASARCADGITHLYEPYIDVFYRCNIWHVRGRDCSLLFDSGLGVVSLAQQFPWLRGQPLLAVASHATTSAQIGAGIRVNTSYHTAGGWWVTPEVRVGLSEEVGSRTTGVSASFADAPSAGNFTLTGIKRDRTQGIAGLGLVVSAGPHLDLFVDADGQFSGTQRSGLVSAGLRWTFGGPAPGMARR